jgi:PAT family beta-lactamase induction signal transducer AmpG
LRHALARWHGAWLQFLAAYARPPVRSMLLLGFSSGLPLPLVLTTLSARLRQAGIDRSTIGYFSLVGLAYSLKYFWSPVVDRTHLPVLGPLGRRRSWMLLSQCGIAAGLAAMALCGTSTPASLLALLAALTAFASATQDIAVDAYRIEAAGVTLQGAMAAAYQTGYQLAVIVAGAGALLLASGSGGWSTAYAVMAALVAVGIATTLLIEEPAATVDRATSMRVVSFLERTAHWPPAARGTMAWIIGAVVCPFADFFARLGWRAGLPVLALILSYRLNYTTMGVAANSFYIDLGYSLQQIAVVSKVYGVAMTLAGALAAGLMVRRRGTLWAMLCGWLVLTAANIFYAYLGGLQRPGVIWLAVAVGVDNFGNGIAGTAFIAFMSALTNTAYTATQYALFGTLWSLPAKSLASQWGNIVNAFGYPYFFLYTAATGLPALLLVLWLLRKADTIALQLHGVQRADHGAHEAERVR